jgi:hypothetical protein
MSKTLELNYLLLGDGVEHGFVVGIVNTRLTTLPALSRKATTKPVFDDIPAHGLQVVLWR